MGRLTAVLLLPLTIYRRYISQALPDRCRYYPSCSTYAVESIKEYGLLKGLVLSIWRVLRCNPFSDGGLDPVSKQRIFKSKTTSSCATH